MDYFIPTLSTLFDPLCFSLILSGCILGIVFGAIPGLTGGLAIVLLLPITYALEATLAISMLIGIYIGSMSGGFIASILIGIPGTPAAISTCFDGYPLSQKGQTAKALGIGIVSSFIGSIISSLIALVASPLIADLAVKLGPWEYAGLGLLAITLVVALSKGDMLKGLAAAAIGIMIATFGFSPIDGTIRFSFGISNLNSGFHIGVVMIGFFAIRQIMIEFAKGSIFAPRANVATITGFGVTIKEILQNTKNIIRSLCIGLGIGFLPGLGGGVSNMVAYAAAKSASKHPEEFGKGSIEGVFAPETANNATIGGAIIPLVALGIPGDSTTALLLGALTIAGLQPGPLLFSSHPDFYYVLFGALFLSGVLVFILQFFGMRFFPKLLKIPVHYLYPVIILLALIGAFSEANTIFNVGIVILFGFLGIFMTVGGLPMMPLVLAYILTPLIETNLRRAVQFGSGSLLPFITRPVSCIFLVAVVVALFWPMIKMIIQKMKKKSEV